MCGLAQVALHWSVVTTWMSPVRPATNKGSCTRSEALETSDNHVFSADSAFNSVVFCDFIG